MLLLLSQSVLLIFDEAVPFEEKGSMHACLHIYGFFSGDFDTCQFYQFVGGQRLFCPVIFTSHIMFVLIFSKILLLSLEEKKLRSTS